MDSNKPESPASCMDEFDPNSLAVDQAVNNILSNIVPVSEINTVHINDALNRVLCQPVKSQVNIPPYTNSAMDGYAVRSADLPGQGHKSNIWW